MSGRRELVSAGAVVLRRGPGGVRVLALHDERHNEWRLPKGKLRAGETAAQAAEREVKEETGLAPRAGRYLGATTYTYPDPADGVPTHKIVYFFLMTVGEDAEVRAEAGTFDSARWLAPHEARERLTWPDEAEMVRRAAAQRW